MSCAEKESRNCQQRRAAEAGSKITGLLCLVRAVVQVTTGRWCEGWRAAQGLRLVQAGRVAVEGDERPGWDGTYSYFWGRGP